MGPAIDQGFPFDVRTHSTVDADCHDAIQHTDSHFVGRCGEEVTCAAFCIWDASGEPCNFLELARVDRFGAQVERVPTFGMLKLENLGEGDPVPDLAERFQGRHEWLGIVIEQRYLKAVVVRQCVRERQGGREPKQPLPGHVGVRLAAQWHEYSSAIWGHLEDLDPVRAVTGEVKATVPCRRQINLITRQLGHLPIQSGWHLGWSP